MAFTGSFSSANMLTPRTAVLSSPSLQTKIRIGGLRAHLREDDDPLFLSGKEAASLRFMESQQPDPLFFDEYAGCWATPNPQINPNSHHYCVVTKFLDDNLIQKVNNVNGFKQVVLLTDGMDTRPYRIRWPMSTIIFDISPDNVFKRAAQDLLGFGAKISRGNFFCHVPLESPHVQLEICSRGFRGDQPSIWVMQGLPIKTLVDFEDVLFLVSSLATKGSYFLGELPSWLAETEIKSKSSTNTMKWMDKLFMGNGFRVETIAIAELARRLGKELTLEPYKNIPFVAEQLRFSDYEMETWRKEFERIENEGDEEGFEEL
ncbi:putative S-adenosyl-L-methionine-dependent methyltransferase Mb0917c [Cucumis melo var. makuwa]|uniref:S-adenosyl-L-methionine-dependent methyltransferase Mb0917c n=1 Tax=Cucumis melo var. makuwa TaxID=1194695 RepID=A0A5A7SJ58_CUCMM|nr:putative S-adenosyl-L-methionine-dependent methyltransferase Mb0917c [Cucumis melo var. makuwa]